MKTLIFLFASLISFNASSAPVEVMFGQFSHPDLGGSGGCNSTRCTASVTKPITYEDYNDTGGPLPDTEDYFWSGNDRVTRYMSMNNTSYVHEDVSGVVTWESGGLYSGGQISVFGNVIDLSVASSGSFYLSLFANTIHTSYIEIMANSVDAFARWTFTYDVPPPPIETPIPASLFLFAPALLVLIGVRRRFLQSSLAR